MSNKYIFISLISIGVFALVLGGVNILKAQTPTPTPTPTPTSITVISPNGGESWQTGETYSITWNSLGIDKVNIYLQTFADPSEPSFGAAAIGDIVTNVSASAGKYSWTIPYSMASGNLPMGQNPVGTNRQVVISEVGGNVSDGSNHSFSIIQGKTCDQKCKSSGYESGICQSFTVTPDGFKQQEEFAKTHMDIGYTSDCYLSGLDGSMRSCYCAPKKLVLTSPNGGEAWQTGEAYDITWKATGIDKVNIYLWGSCDSSGICMTVADKMFYPSPKCYAGGQYKIIARSVDAFSGKYSWTISANQTLFVDAKIMVEDDVSDRMAQTCVQDSSDKVFSIVKEIPKSLTLTSPNGGEAWQTGKTYDITWKFSGIDKINIQLISYEYGWKCLPKIYALGESGEYSKCGPYIYKIASDVPAEKGQYSWTVSEKLTAGKSYKIRIETPITGVAYPDVYQIKSSTDGGITPNIMPLVYYSDESDNYFSILKESSTCSNLEWWCSLTNQCVKKGETCCTGMAGGCIDEHGCNPTAGYTWCDSKQKCLRTWEEACSTPTPTPILCQVFVDCVSGSFPVSTGKVDENGCPIIICAPKPTSSPIPTPGCQTDADCQTGGCSGELCLKRGLEVSSICLWKPEYECFKKIGCKCVDNKCQWQQTSDFRECLSKITEAEENRLIKVPGKPDIYVIKNGKLHHVPSWNAFVASGYKMEEVKQVEEEEIVKRAIVNLIRIPDDPKVYIIGKGQVRHIPNPEVFNSYGFNWGDIVTVSPTELKEYGQANLIRGVGEAKVYLIENGQKRWIETAETFQKRAYDWSKITEVNKTELDAYSTGAEIIK